MNKWILVAAPALLALAAFAIPQQDPQDPEKLNTARVRFSVLQYTDMHGNNRNIDARDIQEIRLVDGAVTGSLLEITYTNGDYSMIHISSLHVIRKGPGVAADINISRVSSKNMIFPLIL